MTSSVQEETAPMRGRAALHACVEWLRSGPVSTVFAVLVLAGWDFQRSAVAETPAGDESGILVRLLPSGSVSPCYFAAVVVLVLAVGIWAERRLGSLRYAIIGVIGHTASIVLVTLVSRALAHTPVEWFRVFAETPSSSVGAWLFATGVAAAGLTEGVMRRRVILLVGVYLAVMVTCAGEARDFEHLVAVGIGLVAGRMIGGPIPKRRVGSRLEAREFIVTGIVAIIAASVISMRAEYFIGPLASVRYLFEASITPEQIDAVCASGTEAACQRAEALSRSTSLGSIIRLAMPWLVQLSFLPGLRRGRQAAAIGTVLLQAYILLRSAIAAATISGLYRYWDESGAVLGLDPAVGPGLQLFVPIIIPLLVIAVVVWKWKLFPVRPVAGWYRRLTLLVFSGVVLGAVVAVAAGLLLRSHLGETPTVGRLVWDYIIHIVPGLRLLSPVGPLTADDAFGRFALDLGTLVPWAVIVVVALRAVTRGVVESSDQTAVPYRDILRRVGAGTLGWMTTWKDNSVWISGSGRAGIAFRGRDGAALTVTDPAASPEELSDAMDEFSRWAVRQGLVPIFYSVHDAAADVARSWGWSCVPVATETVVDLGQVEFKGKAFQDVRTAANRAKKEGVEAEWMTWESAPLAIRDQIEAISQHWAEQKPLPEMGFTLGGVAELDDPEVRLLVAVDEDRTVHGVTSWMPVYEDGEVIGLTLDFMRRRDGGFRPVMEFLIARAIISAQDEGLRVLSLSGAPLVTEADEPGMIHSVLAALSARLEPVYGFNSLYAFKHKFQPRTETMWLAVPEVADLARAARAVSHAYLPNLSVRDTVRLGSELLRSSKD